MSPILKDSIYIILSDSFVDKTHLLGHSWIKEKEIVIHTKALFYPVHLFLLFTFKALYVFKRWYNKTDIEEIVDISIFPSPLNSQPYIMPST